MSCAAGWKHPSYHSFVFCTCGYCLGTTRGWGQYRNFERGEWDALVNKAGREDGVFREICCGTAMTVSDCNQDYDHICHWVRLLWKKLGGCGQMYVALCCFGVAGW